MQSDRNRPADAVLRAAASRADAKERDRAAAKFQAKIRPVAATGVDAWKDEESIRMLEDQWAKFCHSIGLEQVPDIRETVARRASEPPRKRGWRDWLRELISFLNAHP
jgi:hypothetical protein